jgi:cell division protein FtsB
MEGLFTSMECKSTTNNWFYRTRRLVATLCIGVLAVLIGYKVLFGANGTVEWRSKRAEFQQLQSEIDKATLEHQALESRVKKLQSDPNTIIKEAREKLGFVMPGEVVLVQPQPKAEVRNTTAVAENLPATNSK